MRILRKRVVLLSRLVPLVMTGAALTACPSSSGSSAFHPNNPEAPADAGTLFEPEAVDASVTGVTDASVEHRGPILPATLAESVNLFARDLHGALGKRKGNLAYSPLSISLALTMTWGGARGQTATEIARALHLDGSEGVHAKYGRLIRRLESDPAAGAPEVRIASRSWAEKSLELVPAFVSLTRDSYGAPVEKVDFIHDSAGARSAINRWVKEKTHERIPDILPADGVDTTTRIVLVNAIYLKARWRTPFQAERTSDDVFHVDGTTPKKLPTMHAELGARYSATQEAQVLELPYESVKGAELSMVILLPRTQRGLAKVEAVFARSGLAPFLEKLEVAPKVEVSLPRFAVRRKSELRPVLESLGIKLAFERGDLSGIFASERAVLRDVFHDAVVETTESGTEAAAATAATVSETGETVGPKTVFRADHPFLFFIRDVKSGVVLFGGRVTSPVAS